MARASASLVSLVPMLLAASLAIAAPVPDEQGDPPTAAANADASVESVDDRSEARRAFDDGLAAVAAGKYEAAVASFEHAYELRPHPVTLFNLALSLEKAGRRPEAWELFDAVIDIVESDAERRDIRRHMSAIEAEIAIVEIEASPRHRLCIDGFDMPRGEVSDYRLAVEPGVHELLLDDREFSLAFAPGDRRVVLLEGAERLIEGERRSPVVPGMLGLSIGTGAAAVGLGVGAAITRAPQLRTGLAAGAAGSAGLAVIAGVVALAIETRERRRSRGSERTSSSVRCPGSSTAVRLDLQIVPQVRRPVEFATLPVPDMPALAMPAPAMPGPTFASVPPLHGIRPPRRGP